VDKNFFTDKNNFSDKFALINKNLIMPMQKSTASSNASFNFFDNSFSDTAIMQPSDDTIKRIIAYAAVFRMQQISDNQYINFCLN
jgi:hypothetical protein